MTVSNRRGVKILGIERYSENDLVERIKKVVMLEDEEVKAYENSLISLEIVAVEDLCPPQTYILKEQLHIMRELRWELEKHGVDFFRLNGFIRMTLENEPEPVDLLPPIVEESIERNGHIANIICDGMHRVYLAHLEWVIPQITFIRGVPKNIPYYAFPNPDRDWSKIELRDDIPEGFIKKWHRIERNKQLYRNFNSQFKNVGGPRGNVKK